MQGISHLQLIQPGDALGQGCYAVMARERQMSHVSQLLHGFREMQQSPLGLISLALPLWGLITV